VRKEAETRGRLTTIRINSDDEEVLKELRKLTGTRALTQIVRLSLRIAKSTRGNIVKSFKTYPVDEYAALCYVLDPKKAEKLIAEGKSPLAKKILAERKRNSAKR
jgi:hypothetical protein